MRQIQFCGIFANHSCATNLRGLDDFAGVVPIKITTNSKIQEIEFEVGAIPDFRKKVVEFVNQVSLLEFVKEEPVKEEEKPLKKSKPSKKDRDVFVGGLSFKITADVVKTDFSECGKISKFEMPLHDTGISKGIILAQVFGIICFLVLFML